MICREAVADDFEQLVALAKTFTEESGLDLTFNEARARHTIWSALHVNPFDILVVDADEVIAGAALIAYDQDYYDEVVAYVDTFFIYKQFRGLGASDGLLLGVLDAAQTRGATMIAAGPNAAMGPQVEAHFISLFGRYGFRKAGPVMRRIL